MAVGDDGRITQSPPTATGVAGAECGPRVAKAGSFSEAAIATPVSIQAAIMAWKPLIANDPDQPRSAAISGMVNTGG